MIAASAAAKRGRLQGCLRGAEPREPLRALRGYLDFYARSWTSRSALEQREIQALAREVAEAEIVPHAAEWDSRAFTFPANCLLGWASSA